MTETTTSTGCQHPPADLVLISNAGITTCCGAYTSIFIDDGVEYCKCCYRGVDGLAEDEPCNDCGVPTYWDETVKDYRHVDPAAAPCFLVQAYSPAPIPKSAR